VEGHEGGRKRLVVWSKDPRLLLGCVTLAAPLVATLGLSTALYVAALNIAQGSVQQWALLLLATALTGVLFFAMYRVMRYTIRVLGKRVATWKQPRPWLWL
jgi:heme/copper-type cytochrome/quinol oxidase subunit 3